MVNEDRRVKAVFENFDFDPDSMRELEKREKESLQLIKDGKMPVEMMDGEVVIKFDQYQNIAEVPGKAMPLVLVKMKTYTNEGTVKKEAPVGQIAKAHDAETSNYFLRFKLRSQTYGKDKNRQADIIHTEFWMQSNTEKADKAGASFIGEVFVPWKQAMEEGKRNEWQETQMYFKDLQERATGMVQG